MSCYEQGVSIVAMPVLYEQITGRVPIEHVGSHLWTLVLPLEKRTVSFSVYLLIRRVFDAVCALVGLLLFALLLPVLAIAIKLTSRGPVFYRQVRLGRGGRPFTLVKLRTMKRDAENGHGVQGASHRDSRITPIGGFLRRTRLDEAPQLLNIMRGEMSLVGPRPERPEFVERLEREIPFYRTRLAVDPGLTGWAQVRYRYGSSTEDALRKLQYDLYYIRHQSLLLDLEILIRTVWTVLLFRGT
jgi:exopolysaccharide biosynthesis polyprenyl glycosylphosphotransferase